MKNLVNFCLGQNSKRWATLGLLEVEQRFREIKGYQDLPLLAEALEKGKKALDKGKVA